VPVYIKHTNITETMSRTSNHLSKVIIPSSYLVYVPRSSTQVSWFEVYGSTISLLYQYHNNLTFDVLQT